MPDAYAFGESSAHSRPAARASQFEEPTTAHPRKVPKRRDTVDRPTPTIQTQVQEPHQPAPRSKLIFTDPVMYEDWRQFFPLPGTPPARTSFRWEDFVRMMVSKPMNFELVCAVSVRFRFKRAAQDGFPHFEIGMHKPHDNKLTRNLMMHIAKNLRDCTGLEPGDFVLVGQ